MKWPQLPQTTHASALMGAGAWAAVPGTGAAVLVYAWIGGGDPLSLLGSAACLLLALIPAGAVYTLLFFLMLRSLADRQWLLLSGQGLAFGAVALAPLLVATVFEGLAGTVTVAVLLGTATVIAWRRLLHPSRRDYMLAVGAVLAPLAVTHVWHRLQSPTPSPLGDPATAIMWVAEAGDAWGEDKANAIPAGRAVFVQQHGALWRLGGLSPVCAIVGYDLYTVEGDTFVVTPLQGAPRRIPLRPAVRQDLTVIDIQPYPGGAFLNLGNIDTHAGDVARVDLATGSVTMVPGLSRVRTAPAVHRYAAEGFLIHHGITWRHGPLYPNHNFTNWQYDAVADVVCIFGHRRIGFRSGKGPFLASAPMALPPEDTTAATADYREEIALSAERSTMHVASVTTQPGLRQAWAVQQGMRPDQQPQLPPAQLVAYDYQAREIARRTIYGTEARRAYPVDPAMLPLLMCVGKAKEVPAAAYSPGSNPAPHLAP